MQISRLLRFSLSVIAVCLVLWAANGFFYLFNHPVHRGEAAIAIAGLLLLATFLVWLAQWLLRALLSPHESQGD